MNLLFLLMASLLALSRVCESGKSCINYRQCYKNTLSGSSQHCNGYFACQQATYTARHNLHCYGGWACDLVRQTRTVNTYAYGCHSNQRTAGLTTYLYSYGYISNYLSALSSAHVVADGYYAMHSARLWVWGGGLNLYCRGWVGCYNLRLYCRNGKTCNLYCHGNACIGTKFYCYSGAVCRYVCHGAGTTHCPALYAVRASSVQAMDGESESNNHKTGLTDEELDAMAAEDEKEINAMTEEDGQRMIDENEAKIAEAGKQMLKEFGISLEDIGEE